jgi:hypothetical protein
LHPEGDPEAIRSSFPEGFEISRDDGLVLDVLRSFKKGTASGRSGWGVNHLLECCSHQTGVSDVEKHLTAFVNLFLSGKPLQSFAPFMSSATLVPLLKKDGRIRPVAVGEIFRRLVSKCCVKGFADQAARQLCPLQVGLAFRMVLNVYFTHSTDSFVIPHCAMMTQRWFSSISKTPSIE